MFKRSSSKNENGWVLSPDHPVLDPNDTEPLPETLGVIGSLPPTYQIVVRQSFVERIRNAACDYQDTALCWFNTKLQPSKRLHAFTDFTDHCEPNEVVWVYARFHTSIFDILHRTFVNQVLYLNWRASICPVLQDIAHPINPQGILALRMFRDTLSFVTYLASLLPDPQAAYIEYVNLGFIGTRHKPFDFVKQKTKESTDLPPFTPILAQSHVELQHALRALYNLFRKAYLSWIYPYDEGKINCL
ncbi:hypothetical protein LPJ73_005853 [Coemansia sp. RSA 2703]|nr:hypothetical protein LPJ73_005853 [Coemansia sp. RSA 2703]